MKNQIHALLFTLIVTMFMLATPVHAINYYVDQNNPIANDQNPGTIAAPWKTITKANQTLIAGDTVYLKAGIYTAGTANYVAPVNSGTAVNRITYAAYPLANVTIQQGSYAVHLNGNDYITVQGLHFTQLDRFMVLENGADHNIVDGNTFATMRNFSDWAGSRIWKNSDHNILRNNTFKEYGVCSGANDQGSVIDIGGEDVSGDASDYNLFENNTFARGGHHSFGLWSRFNVFRNNYLYNDAWTAGKGNRSLAMGGASGFSGSNLIENNRFGYSYVPCDQGGASGIIFATSLNIFRYNSIYHSNLSGIDMTTYNVATSLNLIYNNTFFNNACTTGCDPNQGTYGARYFGAITLDDWRVLGQVNNRIKNNLYYSHSLDNNQPIGENGGLRASQTILNNFDGDVSGNPLFVNATTTLPTDKTDVRLPDLHLQAGSPAINKGGALTTVLSGCGPSATQIVLADASYFQDGTWGVASEVAADWISVGTVTNAQQLLSISGNTVKFVSAISCTNGNAVWLYKDSDGTRVLYDSAPDVGAYEYASADIAPPAAPTGLTISSLLE